VNLTILEAGFVLSATEPKGWPPPGAPEIAFCGRSNVGKSSCLNVLANRKQLARVSNTPGRTRLINFFALKLAEKTRSGARGREHQVGLVDLPGYGFAKGPHSERESWKKMIERYLTERETLRALVILVDGEIGPQDTDREMVAWAKTLGRRLILVATKLDRLPKTRRSAQLDRVAAALEVPREDVLGFSAKELIGVEELWRLLLSAAKVEKVEQP
jgi:GTP-binding protein